MIIPLYITLFISKWKGDKTSVRSIQVSPEGKSLLSAGRDIRLWDLEKKEILKVSFRKEFFQKKFVNF